MLDHEVAQQAAKGRDLDVRVGRRDLARDLEPLGDGEHGALVVAGGHREDQAVEQARTALHQILVPERHRVEGAWVDGDQRGSWGHVGVLGVAKGVSLAADCAPASVTERQCPSVAADVSVAA